MTKACGEIGGKKDRDLDLEMKLGSKIKITLNNTEKGLVLVVEKHCGCKSERRDNQLKLDLPRAQT